MKPISWILLKNEAAYKRVKREHCIYTDNPPARYPCFALDTISANEDGYLEYLYLENLKYMVARLRKAMEAAK